MRKQKVTITKSTFRGCSKTKVAVGTILTLLGKRDEVQTTGTKIRKLLVRVGDYGRPFVIKETDTQ